MRRLGTMVCVMATLMLFGCDSDTGPIAAPSTTSTPSTTAPPTPADVVTRAQLGAASRDLVRQNTGTFRVRASGVSGSEADALPAVDGTWSLRPRLLSSKLVASFPEQGGFTFKAIVVGRRLFSQALGGGTFFTPACWLRVPAPQDILPTVVAAVLTARSDGRHVTMRLARVLSTIGFQSVSSKLGRSVRGVRVPVDVRVEDGRIKGWEMTGTDLVASVQDVAAGEARTTLLTLLGALPDGVSWTTTVQELGDPVFITEPPASSIVEADGTNQEACT